MSTDIYAFLVAHRIDYERCDHPPVFTVSEAEKAERGDTVSGATKVITCETGLKVKVPLFIKMGDRILVNTETGEYQERVNT